MGVLPGGTGNGFANELGIPGKLEGERYKKTPEMVKETMEGWPVFKAPGRFIVFKRPLFYQNNQNFLMT